MIELPEIKKEPEQNNINNNNNIIKEEKKDNKPSLISKNSKQIKDNKKEEEKKHKINIYLSVNDINNMISMQNEQNKPKYLFFCIIILLALQMTNIEFIFFLAYLRPTLITNKYYCYNSLTKHYKKCSTDSFCYCNHDYCATFCYETDFTKCPDVFKSYKEELIKNKLINLPNYMRSLKFESEIIYPLEEKERLSVFQRIGYYYCFIDRYAIGFISDFSLGCCLGYYIFGLISDLFGRKKCTIILCLINLIANGGIMIISNYDLDKHIYLLTTLWIVFIFLLGISLEPLESAIYIYFMEMFFSKVLIKLFNSFLFMRYFVSLALLCIFNYNMKNFIYFFFAYEVFLIPFMIILIFVFRETPRFYSERQDINNKILGFFIKDFNILSNKENESDSINSKNFQQQRNRLEENQSNSKIINVNYSYLYNKFKENTIINKSYYIILFANIVLDYCFYTIILKFIYFFLNPYSEITLCDFLVVFICLFLIFAALQFVSYFLFEILSFNIIISVLLIVLFIFAIAFDSKDINLTSYRNKIYYPLLSINNKHLLSGSLFFIMDIISIYEMMLIFLSPTLYRSYFFFCQKGVSSFSLIFAFISVFSLDCPLFFIGIISLFTSILFLTLRVKWEKISLKEEINRKVKNL